MKNAVTLYGKDDIEFFLTGGPMVSNALPFLSLPPPPLLVNANVCICIYTSIYLHLHFYLRTFFKENVTVPYTQAAVQKGVAEGLKVTFVDMQAACWKGRYHGIGNSDWCDGCASHPGIEGHRGMYEAAWPVIKEVMGWD